MNVRVLFASVLLLLGTQAHAAMERVHDASGEAASRCPSAQLVDGVETGDANSDIAVPPAPKPNASSASGASAPALSRPTLRWHSFLPGMMK